MIFDYNNMDTFIRRYQEIHEEVMGRRPQCDLCNRKADYSLVDRSFLCKIHMTPDLIERGLSISISDLDPADILKELSA